jgi:DNA-binding helix-hairpin-helix protein with protein kinase domain
MWATGQSGGAPDSQVVHRTSPVHCPVRYLTSALTLRAQSALFTVHCSRCRRPLAQVVVAPLGTLDSQVIHRIVR